MNEEKLDIRADQRITFRLPAEHKVLIEKEARKRYMSQGDVLRELVREWAAHQKTVRV